MPQASFHVLQFTALLYKGPPKHFSVPLCNQAGSAAGTTALKVLNFVIKRNSQEFGPKWTLLKKCGLNSQLSNTAGSDRGRKCRVTQNKDS